MATLLILWAGFQPLSNTLSPVMLVILSPLSCPDEWKEKEDQAILGH